MERFYLERPSIERKDELIEYINEFINFNSEIHGVGSLNKYIDNYEGWLNMIYENWDNPKDKNLVPSHTYLLIRINDNRIVGMIDIRLTLNDFLKYYGGNIGYSIRPTERRKGYNKINLYLGLLECQKYGLDKVMLDCDKTNIGSASTIKSLGGRLIEEQYNDISNAIVQDYIIDVNESLEKYQKYKEYIYK